MTDKLPPPETVMAEETKEEEYETVFLGDVETGNYATVLGAPTYNATTKPSKKGSHYEFPADMASEDLLNQYMQSGKSVATLLKTGFLTAHDLAMLDNTAGTASKLEEFGGAQGLETLRKLATPRKEAMKRRLSKRYDEVKKTPKPQQRSMSKYNDLQPGVQTYLWALDHAAFMRARTRMRRRNLARRRGWELRYDAVLRRGGQPFRGKRLAADTFEPVEEETPIPGKTYYEQGHMCTYWYHPTLKHWTRMIGSGMSVTDKRTALLTGHTPVPTEEDADQTPIYDTYWLAVKPDKLWMVSPFEFRTLFSCIDKQGLPTLRLHQVWIEYKYPSPANPGVCQGLCRFSDGWINPEGADGLPTQFELSFTEHGDYGSTHVLCAACNTRLCKKCYMLLLKHHTAKGAYFGQMINVYFRYRTYREEHPKAMYTEFLGTLPAADLEMVHESPDLSFDWSLTDDPDTRNDPDRALYITRALKLVKSRMRPLVTLGIPKGMPIPPPTWGDRGPIIELASCGPIPPGYVPPQRKPSSHKKPRPQSQSEEIDSSN